MSDVVAPVQDAVEIEKQRNFAELRKIAEQERAARIALEERLAAIEKSSSPKSEDDDEDDEPYVDKRKLSKKLNQFGQEMGQKTSEIVRNEVEKALREERKNSWFKQNSDFSKVMTPELLNKFEAQYEDEARSILTHPDEFERQKLAYYAIKAKGLDRPEVKQLSAQELAEKNRRTPYYQPSGVSNAPYGGTIGRNVSEEEGKTALANMRNLQKNLRI